MGCAKTIHNDNSAHTKTYIRNGCQAFGCAKTIRNDNSSRFGKFLMLQFDQSAKIQVRRLHCPPVAPSARVDREIAHSLCTRVSYLRA